MSYRLDREGLVIFAVILTLLLIPETVFRYLARLEGMSILFLMYLAFIYAVILFTSLPLIVIAYGKKKASVKAPFLAGLSPYLVYNAFKMAEEYLFAGTVVAYVIYFHNVALGLLLGLMGAAAALYKSDKVHSLAMLIPLLATWILATLVPSVTLFLTQFHTPQAPPPPPPG